MNSMLEKVSKLSPKITTMIRTDHTHVVSMFHHYDIDASPARKHALVESVCLALEIHAQLEEEIFYPAMRDALGDNEIVGKSIPEHDQMRALIDDLRSMQPTDPEYDSTFMELMRDVLHHVADEETRLLPDAEARLGDRLELMGAQMTKRRMELAGPRMGRIAANGVRAIPPAYAMVAAGALIAGTMIARRAFRPHL